jgi:hypothetical protein
MRARARRCSPWRKSSTTRQASACTTTRAAQREFNDRQMLPQPTVQQKIQPKKDG